MKMCDMSKLQLFTKFNSNERKFSDTPHGRKQNSQTNHGDRNYMIQEDCALLLAAGGHF